MPHTQITLDCAQSQVPRVEALLEALGALAITLSEPDDEEILEPGPGEQRLWSHLRLTALFDAATVDPLRLQARVAEVLGAPPRGWRVERLVDRAWERAWMDDFHPMRFGDRLWVVPWGQTPPAAEAVNLRLDPGLAFGTGTHPTTALCLRWLDGLPLQADTRLVDYGCGSGILAVAGCLLGAGHCTAVDNDPQARQATADNARRNGVGERIRVQGPGPLPRAGADVLVANILARVLVAMAGELSPSVRPGGRIALSGILRGQVDQVRACYSSWFEMERPEYQGDWALLAGTRRG
ncbi:50S ribosomal protein L11 methyltransferase [Alkalilimnicola ehrlichii MLHE-1]|uniref:Ribosomal protein L11 methyltransferase n=1 Tax=Alkalilimnicola ehrlichii (strain ATCC BAA-1101 / DSM 17681 / MLHE-1) TaxID=187272 RepID=PRMA_ALKEH|nr:50S ribosomal protein L11 methyltransferase [Alkalilimnicola ehrlichii]Q0AB25.1 RecName: Full=Ribosomal protein L11 methyltransferase; Short=L11 Mtase [Alkalilimnicola ehrlichii MLHE-1]ABI55962.1 [LSU ribosomal protein L11P]-lysine N-methyltransferase [Alkalilimnicola ehrlichii MLHE-1]